VALRADVPDVTVDLPTGTWRDVLGGRGLGGRVALADLLGDHGIALLERTAR
jgi:maltooligosyltrehalose synthase